MTRKLTSESGQVVPLVAIVLLGLLLGICALVFDVGAWFNANRQLQSLADAAALAGAQDLPMNPSAAPGDASTYASANGGSLSSASVSSSDTSNDTMTVTATKQAPIFFARVLGINSAVVHARAVAQVAGVSDVNGKGTDQKMTGEPIPLVIPASAAPGGCGCNFGDTVSISWGSGYQLGAGQFGILDFSNGQDSGAPTDIASWIVQGYPGTLGIGTYPGINGNKTMSAPVDGAMSSLAPHHPTVLLPVYTPSGSGNFTVVGWASFKVQSWTKGAGSSTLTGSFVRLDMPVKGPHAQNFGAGKIGLTQ